MSEESLTNKTVHGIGWNSIDRLANYGIGFIVGIVLARLLSPEEYGLIGIIGIFITFFNVILDSGLSTALIRKKDVTHEDYCTVFYVNIALSVILTFILFQCAPFISAYFKRPELTSYIHVMAFILVINALSLTQQARLTKRIDFKTQTKISVISHSLSGIIGIGMAYTGFGVWALVVQQMSSRLFTTVLLWIYNKWWPSLVFSWDSFKTLFSFSWKLLVASVFGVLSNQIYEVVIGKIYSPAALGHYTRGRQYCQLCSYSIGDVVLKVSLPVMSEIQDDSKRLLLGYRRIIKATMLITFLLMFGMAACAKSLIYVLIGEQWLPCVPIMQLLSLSLMLYPLHRININMLTVRGRSDILLYLEIVKILLTILPILMGIFAGLYWMLIGSFVVGLISFFLNSYYSGRVFHYTSWDQIKDILPSCGIALTMAIIVYSMTYLPLSYYILLPFQVVVGLFVAIGLCEWVKLEEYLQLKGIALSYFTRVFHKE